MNNFIILMPLIGAAIVGLGGFLSPAFRKMEAVIGTIATLAVAIPFGIIVANLLAFHGEPIGFTIIDWFQAGGLNVKFSYHLDQLSLLMGMIVTGIGSLIHIYSASYMHGDRSFYKFFLYLNLFIFAMLNLILGDNLVVLFLGWEGVGVCSYLLIGFWYEDMQKAAAAQKAFVANRIGDFAMLAAMFLIYQKTGSLAFSDINAAASSLGDSSFWVALLVFIAATGKSAQIPLYVWLPDAMAGPTPVSALIHAATMVTSGIYLIARIHPVFNTEAAAPVLIVIAIVAAATALMAALIAVAQNDIKKVLAYSTVSQLGFMFMALGAGAYTTAIFHVMTHAFFKACLFLGSGSVIHAMDHTHSVKDPQDIRTMGGLLKYMPSTGRTFWISNLAIAGIPLLSGFFSKDEILGNVFFSGFDHGAVYFGVWAVGVITACLTAFYMTRVTFLTFNGQERFPQKDAHHHGHDSHGHDAHSDHGHHAPHESPLAMTLPLWVLATLAIFGGYLGFNAFIGHSLGLHHPHFLNEAWIGKIIENRDLEAVMHHHQLAEVLLILLAVAISVGVVTWTYRFYSKHDLAGEVKVKNFFGGMYKWMENKFYVDEFYNAALIRPFVWVSENVILAFDKKVIDGAVNGVGSVTASFGNIIRRMQTGLVSNYAMIVSIGVVALLAYMIFGN